MNTSAERATSKQRDKIKKPEEQSGRLRIGNDWNAIRIIALSQNNPLKAVAELVENAIDAHAKNIVITRGKDAGKSYLRISDDGDGVPCNDAGVPDFRRVATHVCDSIKSRLKAGGAQGLQGEFGIGLLSFWTVGEELHMASPGSDGKLYEMRMKKNHPGYTVERRRSLLHAKGTDIRIFPLLSGIRNFHGEKLQAYLASELRDRIRNSGVEIKILDRFARATFTVEPKTYSGSRLHEFSQIATPFGLLSLELYLNDQGDASDVALYRHGTRVLKNVIELEELRREPWISGLVHGQIDAPFLNLTPGTRDGLIHDERLAAFYQALEAVEDRLCRILAEHRQAKEEKTSQQVLRSLEKAFKEAMLALPPEDYDWFEVRSRLAKARAAGDPSKDSLAESNQESDVVALEPPAILTHSDEELPVMLGNGLDTYVGPLFRVIISPTSEVMQVHTSKTFQAICRDRRRKRVEDGLHFHWELIEGDGRIENPESEILTFHAAAEPGISRIQVEVRQGETVCTAEAQVTVAENLLPKINETSAPKQGFPAYTYQRAPGEPWRSRYDEENNLIVINNGHRDFVYSSRQHTSKLRYISRLYAKELVLRNFPGYPAHDLLERLVELSSYVEEQLRS